MKHIGIYLCFLISAFIPTILYAQAKGKVTNIGKIELAEEYPDSLRLKWIKNIGQQQEVVKYYTQTFAAMVFISGKGEIVYDIVLDSSLHYAIHESFIGMGNQKINDLPSICMEGVSAAIVNYCIGSDSDQWITNIPSCNTLGLVEVWPGIDIKLKSYGNNIEKMFCVKPGADPLSICLCFDGIDSLNIDDKGNLELSTPEGTIKWTRPIAYQVIHGKKSMVDVRYWYQENQYGFETENYNKGYALLIDPLIASTMISGSEYDVVHNVTTDNTGNIFITGHTKSYDFPVTTAGYQQNLGGTGDAFISKFSSDLQSLLASTFFGGSGNESGYDVAVDNDGNIMVTGFTGSPDFPTSGLAFCHSLQGSSDVFISKFSNDLSSLIASTYLGGTNSDKGMSLALGSLNDYFITGTTSSSDFPTSFVTYDPTYNGSGDLFISRMDLSLSVLLGSSFLGGSGQDDAYSIASDGTGNVFICGKTKSSDFPVGSMSLDPDLNGNRDAIIAKLDYALTDLLSSSYLGSGEDDEASSLAIDGSGNIYVTGWTWGSDFPVTSQAFDQSFNGVPDCFVAEIDNDLSSLIASTYLGGSEVDQAYSICMGSNGSLFISGLTRSVDFPVTISAYDKTFNGIGDVFVAKINAGLSDLEAATYLGGSNEETGEAICIDSAGDVIVTGNTLSADYPTTFNCFSNMHYGNHDVFVSKLDQGLSGTAGTGDELTGKSRIKTHLNQASGTFRIEYEGTFSLSVIDMMGRVQVFSNERETQVGNLPAGTYVFTIRDGNNIMIRSEKIIIY